MSEDEGHRPIQLFTVRLWSEPLDGDLAEWRGQVRHVSSGETRYFREWSTLVAFLERTLSESRFAEEQLA